MSNVWLYVVLPWLLFLAAMVLAWFNRARLSVNLIAYLAVTLGLLAVGATLNAAPFLTITQVLGASMLTLAGVGLILGFIEFALLPVLGQFRLGAIARVTYYEALLQPFTIIIVFAGIAAITIFARISFFTYNEDFKMYRDVASSFIFLFTLPVMIFASTKVIDEEIENRTMLTLMSKPVSRWQVVLGKYLGIVLLMLATVGAFSLVAGVCCYLRYYDDNMIDYRLTAPGTADYIALEAANYKAFMALLPAIVLTFLQLLTLSAISVAVSTRYGLAANVTTVVIIYIAANLAGYVQTTTDLPAPFASMARLFTFLLPGLSLLDLNQRLVFGDYVLTKGDWAANGNALPSYGHIWQYVGIASVYSLFYVGAALSFGMALFRSRELS